MVMGSVVDFKKGILTPLPKGDAEDIPMSEWLKERLDSQAELHKRSAEALEMNDKRNISKRQKQVTQYPVGSVVLVRRVTGRLQGGADKFKPINEGPKRVVSFKKDQYVLQDLVHPDRHMTVNVTRLRPFPHDPARVNPAEVALLDRQEFIVEEILKHRGPKIQRGVTKSKLSFLVKWVGYPEPTWEPWGNLKKVEALHQYLKRIKALYLLPASFKEKV